MIPKKTNYSQAIIDTIDAQEIERSSKLANANKGITDKELKSETYIKQKEKKLIQRCFRKSYFMVIRRMNSNNQNSDRMPKTKYNK